MSEADLENPFADLSTRSIVREYLPHAHATKELTIYEGMVLMVILTYGERKDGETVWLRSDRALWEACLMSESRYYVAQKRLVDLGMLEVRPTVSRGVHCTYLVVHRATWETLTLPYVTDVETVPPQSNPAPAEHVTPQSTPQHGVPTPRHGVVTPQHGVPTPPQGVVTAPHGVVTPPHGVIEGSISIEPEREGASAREAKGSPPAPPQVSDSGEAKENTVSSLEEKRAKALAHLMNAPLEELGVQVR